MNSKTDYESGVGVGGDDDTGTGSEGGDGSVRVPFRSPSFNQSIDPSGVPAFCPVDILFLFRGRELWCVFGHVRIPLLMQSANPSCVQSGISSLCSSFVLAVVPSSSPLEPRFFFLVCVLL